MNPKIQKMLNNLKFLSAEQGETDQALWFVVDVKQGDGILNESRLTHENTGWGDFLLFDRNGNTIGQGTLYPESDMYHLAFWK